MTRVAADSFWHSREVGWLLGSHKWRRQWIIGCVLPSWSSVLLFVCHSLSHGAISGERVSSLVLGNSPRKEMKLSGPERLAGCSIHPAQDSLLSTYGVFQNLEQWTELEVCFTRLSLLRRTILNYVWRETFVYVPDFLTLLDHPSPVWFSPWKSLKVE